MAQIELINLCIIKTKNKLKVFDTKTRTNKQ